MVAAAALARLSLTDRADEILGVSVMLPQVGQGAIAVECRDDDAGVNDLIRALDHHPTRTAVECERSFLARLGGGCDLPVGAYARASEDTAGEHKISVEAMLATADGRVMLKSRAEGPAASAAELGGGLADELLASGGVELLAG